MVERRSSRSVGSSASSARKQAPEKSGRGSAPAASGRTSSRREEKEEAAPRRASGRSSAKSSSRGSSREPEKTASRASSRSSSKASAKSSPASSEKAARRSGSESSAVRRGSKRSGREDTASRSRRGRPDGDEPKKKNAKGYILAGVGVVLLVAVIVAWGPVNRSMLMGDLRTGDADRRVRAVAALVKYGASAASGLTSALLNQAAEKPWEDASRKDAAYGLALLCDIDFVKKELEGYATEGAGEGKDSDLVRLWVMDGVLRSETTGKFTSNLYRANAKSSNVDLRLKAAEGLGRYHGEKTMEALSALAVDSDKNVALRAAQSIKEAATSKDAKLLVGLLRSESEDLRTSARMALVKVADDLALKTMGVEMRQADEALAREILSVLAEHARNPAAAAEIIAAMKHKSVGIRCQAIEAAAKGRLQETYDGILAACGDSDVKVKISALKAISHIGILGYADKCAGALEDSSPEVRIEAIDVQWKCGNHTTEVLGKFIAMLDDSSGEVSKKALDAIKTIKSRYAGKHGDDNEKWKKWWTVYQEQVSVIDKVEQAIEEVKTLFGNQNTASYKKSKEIIEEQMKNGTALLARKDLVLEIKGKGERHRQRLDSMMDDLQRMLYTSMKHQSSAKR